MALSISGVLGRSTAYTDDAAGVNQFKAEWLTAAQDQKIQIYGTDFNGAVTNYFDPTAVGNIMFDSDAADEANGFKTYADTYGMGVAASYAGWYTEASKIRAEINYDPNTGQSQTLTYKWAPSTTVSDAFIDLSRFVPKDVSSISTGNTEVGFLQAFKNGVAVQISATRMTNETTTATSQTSIQNLSNGVAFTADDATNGDFKFKVLGAFDELRFSAKPYTNPSATQPISSYNGKISDSSDYLVQQIKYTGTADTGTLQFSNSVFTVNENGTPVLAVTVTRTGGSYGAVSGTVNLSNGTATAPGDYTSTPIVVNFADGDTAPKTVLIPINDDTLIENTETVNLTLTNPTGGATIGTQNTATLNILDNDSSIQFASSSFTVNEDGTPVLAVTVTRTGDTTTAASATVNLSNGTATGGTQPFAAGTDYNNAAQVVNFAVGETSKTVVIPINDDTLIEPTETVNLSLSNPTGNATIGAQNTATLNIVDNDSSIQFSQPVFSVNEDGTPVAAVTVTRIGNTANAASATLNLSNGTATGGTQPFAAGTDFDNLAQVVNFAAGETSKTVVVPINDDTLVEPTETVNLSLSNPTGNATIGTQNTATLNILDNDSSIQFSQPVFSVNEDGTPVAAVTVTRIGNTANAASATLNLSNGSATGGTQPFAAGTDFDNTAQVVNFASGETSKTVVVPINDDTLIEPTETVNLSLSNPTGGATIGTQNTATLNILDNDSSIQFSQPVFSVNEDGTPVAAVTVTRIGSTANAASATLNLTNGTATGGTQPFAAGTDYNNATQVVNFAVGETSKTVVIPINDDTQIESTETVNLSLSNPTGNATIGTQNTATLDILDNDSSIQFSDPVFSVNEDGTPVAAVTVTRIGNTANAADVTLSLIDGTAIGGTDYNNAAQIVSFASGETSKTVVVPITDDTLVEPTETVNLILSNPTGGATIGTQNTAILDILDNDSSIQFSDPVFSVNEDGTPVAAVTVTRIGNTANAASATLNLSNGSAIGGSQPFAAGTDFDNTAQVVNFAVGETSKTVVIPVNDDTLVEPTETVNLSLSNPTGGATIGTQNTATLDILDNDSSIQFSNPQYVVNEDGTPILAVTVTRTGNTANAVSATVNLSDGTATAPSDYNNSPITVSFAAGDSTPKVINIPIVDDTLVERTPTERYETVNLALTNPTGGATIGTQDTATLTILDNDAPIIKPVVFVTALDPVAGEPGRSEGTGAFQFARTGGDITQAVTIRYTTTGTATAGADYTPLTGTVTIAAGQSVSAPVTITALTDGTNEPTESVIVKVAEDTAYQVGAADTASVSIVDNDALTGTPLINNAVLRYNSSGVFQNSYANITNAVAGASANDIIVMQAGTYTEPGTVNINKPLTLRGPNAGVSPTDSSQVTPAIVQNTLGQPVFTIAAGANNVTIEGLTIQMGGTNGIYLYNNPANLVIRQNTFTGSGPANSGVMYLQAGASGSSFSATVVDNLIRDVSSSSSTTSGVQVLSFGNIRVTDNQIANLTGPGVAADSVTNFGVITANKVSNVGEQGIQLAGGNGTIDNNDITNANTINDIQRGGIRLRDGAVAALGNVSVVSNTITNSYNGVVIRPTTNVTSTVNVNNNNLIGNANAGFYHGGSGNAIDATNNWWDDITGPVVGVSATGRNAIAGVSANLVNANPFSTAVL